LKFLIFLEFLAKIGQSEKIKKNENFQNRPNMTFLWSKMTLSDIISTENSKSLVKSENKVSQNTFKTTPEDDLDRVWFTLVH